MNYEEVAKLLGAASHQTRLRILSTLTERSSTGQDLANLLGIPRTSLQKHLDYLARERLIVFDESLQRYRLDNADGLRRILAAAPELFPKAPKLPDDL